MNPPCRSSFRIVAAGEVIPEELPIQKRCQTKMLLEQLAILLSFSAFLALSPVQPQANPSQRVDPTMDRLASVSSFAFGGVGFALSTSQGELDYRAILSRKSAAADFETIFRIGNPQAKCYSLTGLRQVNPSRFESLAVNLQSLRTCVAVTRGCVTFSQSAVDTVKQIRSGIYSGPLTHQLIPAPELVKAQTADQEQTTSRLFAFFSLASRPKPPPPPPGPPPPPSEPGRRLTACIAEETVGSR